MGAKSEKSSAESSERTGSKNEVEDNIPDGGWGWAVCAGSFLVNFILDGTMFSFGVLLLNLLEYFGQGKAKTSWIGSCLLGWSMFMGPVVSVMLERYSCRQVTIAGAVISVAAFVVSTFSPNVEMMIISYGVIAGIGYSMSFIAAIIIVGVYFKRKRAIATGIAMSGSGLGTFAYAYLTNFLLQTFDWKGTVLILSGIQLHVVMCGLLFRPLTQPTKQNDVVDVTPNELEQFEKASLVKPSILDEKPHLQSEMPHRLTRSTHLVYDVYAGKPFASVGDLRARSKAVPQAKSSDKVFNQMLRKDIFYSGSLHRIPCDQQCHPYREVSDSPLITCSSEKSNKTTSSFYEHFIENLMLFKDKTFILLLIVNVAWTVQSVPLTYIPDLAVSKQLRTSQAAMLISIVGVTNIVGRVLSGIVTDVFKIQSVITYTVALLTAALANFLFPWCEGFVPLAIVSGVFGLCMATAVSMRTIVIADHLGMDKLTRAFGMIALFQGIAFMANAPLAGFLYEEFESYLMPFIYAGSMYFISGTASLAIYCLSRGDSNVKKFEIVVTCEQTQENPEATTETK